MKILLFILALSFSLVAQAPVDKNEWGQITFNTDKAVTTIQAYWYRKDSVIHPKKDTVKFWMREQSTLNGKWSEGRTVSLVEINCTAKEIYIHNQIEYDAKGEVVSNIKDLFKGEWEAAPPDSVGADMVKKMCSFVNLRSP